MYIPLGFIILIIVFDLSNTIADEIKKFLVTLIFLIGSIFESPKNEINEKTNNRFTINKNNIYISLYDYSDNNIDKNKSKYNIWILINVK